MPINYNPGVTAIGGQLIGRGLEQGIGALSEALAKRGEENKRLTDLGKAADLLFKSDPEFAQQAGVPAEEWTNLGARDKVARMRGYGEVMGLKLIQERRQREAQRHTSDLKTADLARTAQDLQNQWTPKLNQARLTGQEMGNTIQEFSLGRQREQQANAAEFQAGLEAIGTRVPYAPGQAPLDAGAREQLLMLAGRTRQIDPAQLNAGLQEVQKFRQSQQPFTPGDPIDVAGTDYVVQALSPTGYTTLPKSRPAQTKPVNARVTAGRDPITGAPTRSVSYSGTPEQVQPYLDQAPPPEAPAPMPDKVRERMDFLKQQVAKGKGHQNDWRQFGGATYAQELAALQQQYGGGAPTPPGPAQPATQLGASPATPARPATNEDYQALAAGSYFVNPADGKVYRKQ